MRWPDLWLATALAFAVVLCEAGETLEPIVPLGYYDVTTAPDLGKDPNVRDIRRLIARASFANLAARAQNELAVFSRPTVGVVFARSSASGRSTIVLVEKAPEWRIVRELKALDIGTLLRLGMSCEQAAWLVAARDSKFAYHLSEADRTSFQGEFKQAETQYLAALALASSECQRELILTNLRAIRETGARVEAQALPFVDAPDAYESLRSRYWHTSACAESLAARERTSLPRMDFLPNV